MVDSKEIKILEFFKGLGTVLLYYVISLIMGRLIGKFYYHDNIVVASLAQICLYVVLLCVLGIIYHKRLIHDFKSFKGDYVGVALKNWIIGIGVMFICNLIISSVVGGIASNEEANRNLIASYPVSSFITMVFLGPLIEEITFRASFKKAFNKWYLFALVTALIFGSAHILSFFTTGDFLELLYLLPYSALGFFFGKAFFETDNIYTSYLVHMIHNGVCVILLLILNTLG